MRQWLHMAIAATALLAFTGFDAAGQGWRRVDYPEDGFSIEFSGEVQVSATGVDEESKDRILRSTDYLQDNDRSAFIVAATLVRYTVDFDNGVQASYGTLKCKTTLNDTPLDFAPGPARSVSGSNCGEDGSLSVEARYYSTGKWFYQVLAIFTKGEDDADALRFVNSFALLGR